MDVKLCYIFTSAGLKSDSIQKKVIAQINGLNANGVECRGFFFTQDVKEITHLSDNIELIPYPFSGRKYFDIIWQKRLLIKTVTSHVEQHLKPGELIYMRYPGLSYSLLRFVRMNRNKVISEHQAKEIDEYRSAKGEHPLGFNASKIISYFLYQFWPVMNEQVWRRPYARCLKAKVAVTAEIADYHRQFSRQVWMIANGIETGKYKTRTVPAFESELRILFLKGTSGLAPWNGLDRLISSIDAYRGEETRIKLIICGSRIQGEIPERDYIEHRGYVEGEALDRMFSEVHLGCSTLCLYRKNLNEAAVLKAREYFTRGLPFIYAYTDPDLHEEDPVHEFVIKLPNNDSLIDMNAVIEFYKRIAGDISHPEKMRDFAEKRLDWNYKMGLLKNHLMNTNTPTHKLNSVN